MIKWVPICITLKMAGFAKRYVLHTSNLPTLTIYIFRLLKAMIWNLVSRTFNGWQISTVLSLDNQVMALQVQCMWKPIGVAETLTRATSSVQENLLDPLRLILCDQQKEEFKLNSLKGCLLSHNYPQGVRFNISLKIKEPSHQMVRKWATILTDCSRQLTDASPHY